MSSSMRNALQRRNHKERSQPAERARWGLLEKRKDYKLRSQDYKRKKKATAELRAVARDRNPDEYRPTMTRSRTTDGGIKVSTRPESTVLSNEQTLLLKTQDAGYLRTQAVMERRKIEALEEKLAFVGGEKKGGHTVFVNTVDEAKTLKPEEYFDTHPEMLGRQWNRMRTSQLAAGAGIGKKEGEEADVEAKDKKKMAKEREKSYRELEARMKREEDLRKVERELELQRQRMGKGNTTTKNKWAKVRKR
ncbi:small-subunit processome [Geopyxis carbonaria]|nr:small-subunit processome [Geopyxis carbonaria]